MRCSKCLEEISTQDRVCPHCGATIKLKAPEVYQLAPGTVLNQRYECVSVLGYGGFGVVYKAWDTNLKRPVAIKEYFPTTYLSRDEGSTRVIVFDPKNEAAFLSQKEAFLQEARNMACFNEHPNIVHVFDFFEENGTAYFAMEYMDGKTVGDYLKEAARSGKVLTVDSAVHIVREVLNALKATHAKGIIHRDIKPQNIYVLNNGTIKLYDFGAARFADTEEEQTRTIIITPGYAPIEQYQTKSKQGPFTDIYALGAVLYELLTGKRPDESINRKVKDLVEPPSHLNSKISPALESVILRAMAIYPEIRFQSAAEFDRALRNGKKIRNVNKEIRKRKHRRNRFVFVLITALLLAFVYSGWLILDDYFKVKLAPVTLSIWAPVISEGDEETSEDWAFTENLYNEMLSEFRETYPHVKVDLTIKSKETYSSELAAAMLDGTGPDAFDSSLLGRSFKGYYAPVDEVYEDFDIMGESGEAADAELDNYYYLESRRDYFESIGKIPLLVNFNVLYANSGEEKLPDSREFSDFVNGDTDYIGTVLDYDKVQNAMTGKFEIQERLYTEKSNKKDGKFLNYWSINKQSLWLKKDACGRLIHYFLSANSQGIMSFGNSDEADGSALAEAPNLGIPLSKEAYDIYMGIYVEFSYLEDLLEDADLE